MDAYGGPNSEAMNMNSFNDPQLDEFNSNAFVNRRLSTMSRATQVENHAGNYPKAFGLVYLNNLSVDLEINESFACV